jgi:hypothetical protein
VGDNLCETSDVYLHVISDHSFQILQSDREKEKEKYTRRNDLMREIEKNELPLLSSARAAKSNRGDASAFSLGCKGNELQYSHHENNFLLFKLLLKKRFHLHIDSISISALTHPSPH